MKKSKKKIIMGMSGGVDSAVAVALLQEENYEVEGIFLEFWKGSKSEEDFKSAKKMANILDIPLSKIDVTEDFKKKVVDKFIKEYKNGNTPNPCVICNPQIKFDVLLREINKRGVDFVATGHYVRLGRKISNIKLQDTNKNQISNFKNTRDDNSVKEDDKESVCLFEAKDKLKDQSYFLYGLSQEQLKKTIFPLGNLLKSEVKKIAEDLGLSTGQKKESQDVCFISQNNLEDFLRKYIKDKLGEIQDTSGKVLGKHSGLHFYTIGQRKGIDIGGDGPYFVIRKDIENNLLIVSNDKGKKNLWKDNFKIKNANWIAKDVEFPLRAEVKVRYHSNSVCATIMEEESSKKKVANSDKVDNCQKKIYRIELKERQEAITVGQSAVFYSEEGEVLGGGIII